MHTDARLRLERLRPLASPAVFGLRILTWPAVAQWPACAPRLCKAAALAMRQLANGQSLSRVVGDRECIARPKIVVARRSRRSDSGICALLLPSFAHSTSSPDADGNANGPRQPSPHIQSRRKRHWLDFHIDAARSSGREMTVRTELSSQWS